MKDKDVELLGMFVDTLGSKPAISSASAVKLIEHLINVAANSGVGMIFSGAEKEIWDKLRKKERDDAEEMYDQYDLPDRVKNALLNGRVYSADALYQVAMGKRFVKGIGDSAMLLLREKIGITRGGVRWL